ncbi:MAG: hypothetical protein IJ837_03555 [Clostridia bacterium]|nr:hypothetical protein [Clostridia bacterium]
MKDEIKCGKKDENLFTWINGKVQSIQKKWLVILLSIVINLLMCFLLAGFYFLPFINYKSLALKIIFGVIWIFGAVCMALIYFFNKKSDKEHLLAHIITTIFFVITFGLIFVHNNIFSFGTISSVLTIILFIFFLLIGVISLLVVAKNDKKIFIQALILFVVGFLLFCFFYGALINTSVDESIRKYIAIASFFALVALILGFYMNYLFKSDKYRYTYIFSGLFLGIIVILFFISWIIHYFDNSISIMGVFVQFFASAIAGGLTVFGVALTIKNGEKERKYEEKNKIKPYLKNFYMTNSDIDNVTNKSIEINKNKNYKKQSFKMYLQNISDAIAIINGLVIYNEYYTIGNIVLEKNAKVRIDVDYFKEKIEILKEIKIIASDIQENYYEFDMLSDNICEKSQCENISIGLPVEIKNADALINKKIN